VSDRYPELAFDFAVTHWDRMRAMLEPDSRNQYVPRLVNGAHDPALVGKLQAFAEKNIPANAREAVVKAKAAIAYYARVRKDRLPEVDRWLAHT
jgi:aminopeptidase N